MSFDSETHHLFVYQKEHEKIDFIFGAGWGSGPIWDKEIEGKIGSGIPDALRENEFTVLNLGIQQNHQYYIRNGASGTENLLLKFVGSESHWRGSDIPFQILELHSIFWNHRLSFLNKVFLMFLKVILWPF